MHSKTTNEPGRRWRFLAHHEGEEVQLENQGMFDELVVDDWLHVEQMDNNVWWLRLGDARLLVTISDTEPPTVDIERGAYGPIKGDTRVFKPESSP
jgi:hypothetical protein